MKTLLIDNYDSFTYNLFQLLAEVNGEAPTVVRNDAARWDELAAGGFDNVVLSPGPGRPDDAADFGVCADAIRGSELPLLGVCLGHQGVCWAHGARVERAPAAVHGRLSTVTHGAASLFAGIPSPLRAVRYHSLCVDPGTLPAELEPLAWSDDGVLMAVAHRSRPLWGVQFHPESIATEHGRRLLANFRDLTPAARRPSRSGRGDPPASRNGPAGAAAGQAADSQAAEARGWRLRVEAVEGRHDPEAVFAALYADSANAFWLDSARVGDGARFSFMGDDRGPHGAVVSYEVGGARHGRPRRRACRDPPGDHLRVSRPRTGALARRSPVTSCRSTSTGGLAGYLGYELKADCGGERARDSPLPDAALVFADRMLAFDQLGDRAYVVCLTDDAHAADAERWIVATADRLASLGGAPARGVSRPGRRRRLHARALDASAISTTSRSVRNGCSTARATRSA